ncbi:hypothetical protein ACF3NG_07775 [Aerococcaceae bacterium WGS1372]
MSDLNDLTDLSDLSKLTNSYLKKYKYLGGTYYVQFNQQKIY